jgi:folylpolyglutamate synthase/dihydropteroate synthase
MAVLSDKDAEAMVAALAPRLDVLVATETGGDRGRPAASLAQIARDAGIRLVEEAGDPGEAIRRARQLALEAGGVALITGSHYLLQALWTARPAPS